MNILAERLLPAMLVALGLAALPGAASAATVTLSGTSFDLGYDSDLVGVLGAPLLNGNTIRFSPVAFSADSPAGAGTVTVSPSVELQLMLHPGQQITGIAFAEQGLYQLRGSQSYTDVRGEIGAVFAANGIAAQLQDIAPSIFPNFVDGVVRPWAAGASLDFSGVGMAAQAQGISIGVRPVLEARTLPSNIVNGQPLPIAVISTTGDLLLTVSAVPEPGIGAMLMAGLALLGAVARRRLRRG